MTCPRCENNVKYGSMECPKCGLRFRYREDDTTSPCKRNTASILCYLGGALGLHNFYLGNIFKGALRLMVFFAFCGFFVAPQLMQIYTDGTLYYKMNALGILGLVMVAVFLSSYILAMIEFVRLLTNVINTDSKGYKLK